MPSDFETKPLNWFGLGWWKKKWKPFLTWNFQVRGSLARRALLELESKNLIKLVRTPPILDFLLQPNDILQVVAHSSQMIYTRMVGDAAEDEKEEGGVVVSNIIINLLSHASFWSLPSYRLRRKARARRTKQKLKLRPRLRRRLKPNLHVSCCLGGLVRPLGCLCIRRIPCQHILFQKWASSNEG